MVSEKLMVVSEKCYLILSMSRFSAILDSIL